MLLLLPLGRFGRASGGGGSGGKIVMSHLLLPLGKFTGLFKSKIPVPWTMNLLLPLGRFRSRKPRVGMRKCVMHSLLLPLGRFCHLWLRRIDREARISNPSTPFREVPSMEQRDRLHKCGHPSTPFREVRPSQARYACGSVVGSLLLPLGRFQELVRQYAYAANALHPSTPFREVQSTYVS